MTGHPKGSPWYSTPRSKRRRQGVEVTLSAEARVKLDTMAESAGESRSAVVERLIREAGER